MLYLVIQRKLSEIRQREKEVYTMKTKELWYKYLLQEGNFVKKLIPRNGCQIESVEEILLSYKRNIFNKMMHTKIKYFAKAYLAKYYRHEMKSKVWRKRLNAMYRVIDFEIESLIPFVDTLPLKSLSQEEHLQILKMFSLMKKERFLQKLLETHVMFSETEYRVIFAMLEEDMLEKLFFEMDKLERKACLALIDAMAVNGHMDFVKKLEQLLINEWIEIRVRALKAIEMIGVIENLDIYIPFISSPIWEERLMMAKLLKHAPFQHTEPYLLTLLEDSNWWVRSQAARTIIENRQGAVKLESYIETAADRYAIEMAKEVLKEVR